MVRLEPLEERDCRRIVEWIDSPELLVQWAGTAFSYPLTEDRLREHFETDDTEPIRRGFKAVADGRMLGIVELDRIDREHDSARLARVFVEPDERDRGLGAEIVRLILAFGFKDLGLHRIALSVFDFNDPAKACYETVGFVREGVCRDAHYHNGEYLTTVRMSILENEWRRMADE